MSKFSLKQNKVFKYGIKMPSRIPNFFFLNKSKSNINGKLAFSYTYFLISNELQPKNFMHEIIFNYNNYITCFQKVLIIN